MNSSLRSKRRTECKEDRRSLSKRGPPEAAGAFRIRTERQPTTQKDAASNETAFRADVPITSLPWIRADCPPHRTRYSLSTFAAKSKISARYLL
jgi:hypothetical protein